MAEPTLKDVLAAVTAMRAEMATKAELAKLDAKVEGTISKLETLDAKVDAHRAETQAHRLETEKGFRELDRELTKHAEVHAALEKDVATLKRRPTRTAARPARRR